MRIDFQPRFQIPERGENVLLLAVTERSTASAACSMGAKVEQEDLISPAREGYCELCKIRFVRADAVADDDGRRRRVRKGRFDEPARELDAVLARENDFLIIGLVLRRRYVQRIFRRVGVRIDQEERERDDEQDGP